jgi:hypothetical protein
MTNVVVVVISGSKLGIDSVGKVSGVNIVVVLISGSLTTLTGVPLKLKMIIKVITTINPTIITIFIFFITKEFRYT